jgi:hypothetical protein
MTSFRAGLARGLITNSIDHSRRRRSPARNQDSARWFGSASAPAGICSRSPPDFPAKLRAGAARVVRTKILHPYFLGASFDHRPYRPACSRVSQFPNRVPFWRIELSVRLAVSSCPIMPAAPGLGHHFAHGREPDIDNGRRRKRFYAARHSIRSDRETAHISPQKLRQIALKTTHLFERYLLCD